MAKTRTTKTARTPKPIPAMLEGSFATKLENLIAEQNNRLARQGLLTDDPQFEFLRVIRKEITKAGLATFERVAVATGAAPTPAPAASAAPAETPSQPVKRKTRKSVANAAPSAGSDSTPAPARPVRECSEDEVMGLVVEGTMGQDGAPYGVDSKGAALAPYGVKKDGTPKRRRGLGSPPWEQAPETGEASDDSDDSEEVTEDSDETAAETAEASDDSDDSEEDDDSDDDDDDDDGSLDLSDDELDDILADI